jgi:hypothetical protein
MLLDTQALPATQSVFSDSWREAQKLSDASEAAELSKHAASQAGEVAQLSTCEFLEEELSALHAARAAERAAMPASAGLTCEMLQAEIRNLTSQPPSPPGQLANAEASGGSLSKALQLQKNGLTSDANSATAKQSVAMDVEQLEVQRLTQKLETYEREVVPQLMVKKVVLNCELATVRSAALKAAEESERDKQALRSRVAQAEAETEELRSQLVYARSEARSVALGRRGGG